MNRPSSITSGRRPKRVKTNTETPTETTQRTDKYNDDDQDDDGDQDDDDQDHYVDIRGLLGNVATQKTTSASIEAAQTNTLEANKTTTLVTTEETSPVEEISTTEETRKTPENTVHATETTSNEEETKNATVEPSNVPATEETALVPSIVSIVPNSDSKTAAFPVSVSTHSLGMLLDEGIKRREKFMEMVKNHADTALDGLNNLSSIMDQKNAALEVRLNMMQQKMELMQRQMNDFIAKTTATQEANTPKKKGNLKKIISLLQGRVQALENSMLNNVDDDDEE